MTAHQLNSTIPMRQFSPCGYRPRWEPRSIGSHEQPCREQVSSQRRRYGGSLRHGRRDLGGREGWILAVGRDGSRRSVGMDLGGWKGWISAVGRDGFRRSVGMDLGGWKGWISAVGRDGFRRSVEMDLDGMAGESRRSGGREGCRQSGLMDLGGWLGEGGVSPAVELWGRMNGALRSVSRGGSRSTAPHRRHAYSMVRWSRSGTHTAPGRTPPVRQRRVGQLS